MIYFILNKELPWSLTVEAANAQLDKAMLASEAERAWAATRLWLITYVVFRGENHDELTALFDALHCRAHIRSTQLDGPAHLSQLGLQFDTAAADGAVMIDTDRSMLAWAMHFSDARTFAFLVSRGAALSEVAVRALSHPNAAIAHLTATAFAWPAALRGLGLLSAATMADLLLRGADAQASRLFLHCNSLGAFEWCERNLPAALAALDDDDAQAALHGYVVHDVIDVARRLLSLPAFASLFPVNRTLRLLLEKRTIDAVRLLHDVYGRVPAPISFDDGTTALQYAAGAGNEIMVRALLDAGDHAHARRTNSLPLLSNVRAFGLKTAADYARDAGHADLATIIETYVPSPASA